MSPVRWDINGNCVVNGKCVLTAAASARILACFQDRLCATTVTNTGLWVCFSLRWSVTTGAGRPRAPRPPPASRCAPWCAGPTAAPRSPAASSHLRSDGGVAASPTFGWRRRPTVRAAPARRRRPSRPPTSTDSGTSGRTVSSELVTAEADWPPGAADGPPQTLGRLGER